MHTILDTIQSIRVVNSARTTYRFSPIRYRITWIDSTYCLPKLQEIVVPVADAEIMSPHAVTKTKNILMAAP